MFIIEPAGNTMRMNIASRIVKILLTIITKPLHFKLSNDEKQEVSTWWNTLLKQVKSYIGNNFNSGKVNVIDPTKDNFTQPMIVKKILNELEISKENYYRAFSI